MTRIQRIKVLHMRRMGCTAKEIAEDVGVDVTTVYGFLRASGLKCDKPTRKSTASCGMSDEDVEEMEIGSPNCADEERLR